MLKISKPLGSAKVTEYYRVDYTPADQRYYRDGRKELVGEWHGQLARSWGLIDGVDELHYARMADGKHPHTGEQLIKHRPPAETVPWIKSNTAWREHLESLVESALIEGNDPFRTVPKSEWRHKAPKLESPPLLETTGKRSEREKKLLEMHEIARQTYIENLEGERGSTARAYLDSRHVSEESRRQFGLGFADPSGAQLVQKLEHYGPELMEASGLFVKGRRGEFMDRFRGRLMFPITDRQGEVIAFAGRQITDDEGQKYINSPATELYQKSQVLYNLHRAQSEAAGRVVMVEGYMDVVAAHSSGVRAVVALSGTSLSKQQAKQITSIASDVVLNLDGDEAGRKAAEKHVATLHGEGLRVRVAEVTGDPDSFIRTSGGEAYRERIDGARPLIEWLSARAREHYEVSTAEGKADALRWMLERLQSVPGAQREQISKEVSRYWQVKAAEVEKPKHAEHIAAWDWTLAPHKSYSATALVGGDKGLIGDHKEAVRVALDAGEKYTQARLRNTGPITSANWAAALFLHDTARPVNGQAPNPHLHTHAVAFNMTGDGTGKIRSIQSHEWYRVQSYVSAIYQAELAYRALQRGYELEHSRNFSTRIRGYSDEYLEAISARTKEIKKEKQERGLVGAEADERVNKRLREAKQTWDPETLREEHSRQAAAFGQDPQRIVAEARERRGFALSLESRQRLADEAVSHARDRLQESQAVNDHYEIMRDALRYGLGRLRLRDVEVAFERRLAQEQKEFVQVGHYRQNAPGARYTTENMRALEAETIHLVVAGQGKSTPIAAGLTRDQFRTQYKERETDGRKIHLSDSQLWMAYNVLTSPNQYMVVRGAAGVGKSVGMEPIAEIARHHGKAGYEVYGRASTSGAANNLAEIGITSDTLQAHNYRGVEETAAKRLYLIDEGSLVGTRQFHEFVKNVRAQDRVVIAYDPRQHQSVEAGRIVEELEQAMHVREVKTAPATFRLEKIMRQRNAPELLTVINKFKDGKTIEGLKLLDEQCRVWEVPDRTKRFEVMAGYYADHPDTLIVSPDNRSIGEMNSTTRAELRRRGMLGEDRYEARVLIGLRDVRDADRKRAVMYEPGNVVRWGKAVKALGVESGDYTPIIGVNAEDNQVTVQVGKREVTYDPRQAWGVEIYQAEDRKFAAGERIQVTRPWKITKTCRIPNRAIGVIRELDEQGNARLEMEDGRQVRWKVPQMPHVDYAYAMTSYSLQYATSENVLVHIDTGDSRIRTLLDKALVYVGTSRGSSQIHVFTDDRETLLSEDSPVNRVALKPKALSRDEIEGHAEGLQLGAA